MNANVPISEQWKRAADIHADLESAASLLEETKSAVLSQMMAKLGDMPVSRAEFTVKASDEWAEHVHKIVEARSKANKAKVQAEYIRMTFYEWQSAEANHRAGARM